MNSDVIQFWQTLPAAERREIFQEVAALSNLPASAVEKDWWVVHTLAIIYTTEIAPHTVFKGGTSLSKAWKLIDRFSEDIDLALDRAFLGFNKEMTGSQVLKLRKQSHKYISTVFFPLLEKGFADAGFTGVQLQIGETVATDQDPLVIAVVYESVVEPTAYLQPRVLIEIGSRSLREPFTEKQFSSLVGEYFEGKEFADACITVPTVNPERTFLEKVFLLHEEFQQPSDKVRVERKSRHLYDLEKLMDTPFAVTALADIALYQHIVDHRRTVTPLRGIDYTHHAPDKIDPVPPSELLAAWERDYKAMQESMLYNPSLPFAELLNRIKELKKRINALKWGHQ